jgi:group I intron endonuclease
MASSGIYRIVNKQNGKFYVGSSCDIRDRFYNHKSQLNRNIHDNPHLQNAWNKYGESNFDFVVIRECKDGDLILEEQKELDVHFGRDYCYNISPSADVAMRGIPRSDEVKLKCSLAQRGKSRWTEEQRKQMSIDRKGRKHKPETIAKFLNRKSSYENIRKAQLFNVGRCYSEEHKHNISVGKIMANKEKNGAQ